MWNVSPPSRREKIEYPSRIKGIDEEDKIQKIYSSQSINQADRETISYSDSICGDTYYPWEYNTG
jgi:succinate dehydrogenase flavin-adding protein (antitoxin of CptAB toxin-antitoxin module)